MDEVMSSYLGNYRWTSAEEIRKMLRCCRFMREREGEIAHAPHQLIYPERDLLDDTRTIQIRFNATFSPHDVNGCTYIDTRTDCLFVFCTSRRSDGSVSGSEYLQVKNIRYWV